ncbi:DUF881 domain-containing protein [Clostridium oryzae]|uniref:Division initiation protein n=1 Tax=Clostridium oryzae TaxID=1450648 RepID=A0A1V4ITW6_9CLOT|nr:DUF881 domain-containing protein [Clostridium oryzae]OPJ63235.1 hypothetical protein CLORY_13180 [Clostridium oryzae]
MKLKKLLSQLTVGIVCALLGFMLTYQFKLLNKQNIDTASNQKYSSIEVTSQIEQLKENKKQLEKKNQQLMEQIKHYEEMATSSSSAAKEIKDELDNSRVLLGYTDVKGPGIILSIAPQSNIFSSKVESQYIDHTEISYLINELFFSGAEAVSINGNRVTLQTGISSTSDYIIVNNERISPSSKITIKAIGDKEKMAKDLDFPGVMTYQNLTYYDHTVQKLDNIKITKSNTTYSSEYLKNIDKK